MHAILETVRFSHALLPVHCCNMMLPWVRSPVISASQHYAQSGSGAFISSRVPHTQGSHAGLGDPCPLDLHGAGVAPGASALLLLFHGG